MIASERSLAATHKTSKQQQTATLGKPRNGTKPARPVKIYVIDPRKLQQRLEAYVDQKNQKRAEAEAEQEKNEKEKGPGDQALPSQEEPPPSPSPSIKSPVKNKTANGTIKRTPTKVLPEIAPRITQTGGPPTVSVGTSTSSQTDPPVTLNGVALQSLSCIDGNGLGLPPLPLVVANGVALIQPHASQSSITAGGLFLPGITAIQNVISGPSVIPQQTLKPALKRKVKKKKAVKKRKSLEKHKEEEDDGELSYLLKETTTRLGRVSRPVSQPHSPSLTASVSAASSRAPSPNAKLRRKVPRLDSNQMFGCDVCVQVFPSQDKLKSHFEEFPEHMSHRLETGASKIPHEILKSTKAPITATTLSSLPFLQDGNIVTNKSVDKIIKKSTTKKKSKASKRNGVSNLDSIIAVPGVENPSKDLKKIEDFTSLTIPKASIVFRSDAETHLSSLVPTTEENPNLLRQVSNVVQVPSSYSLPSSPPSRCHSPGLPDNIFTQNSHNSRDVGSSPIRNCNSPIDPMLLRSRSPFPVAPNNPETSSHSVGASNLSIPEESLCKGELFMDLGDGVLDTPGLSGLPGTPFGENGATMRQLFSDSDCKDSSIQDRPDPSLEETQDKDPGSKGVTPMLLETTTEDANDGEIFQTANYTRAFLHPSILSASHLSSSTGIHNSDDRSHGSARNYNNGADFPRTPMSTYVESDISMDSSAEVVEVNITNSAKCRSVWHFVKEQIKSHGISQACGEISEMADKLSRIARDHFIPIREDEVERLGSSSSIINVDTPFFSHLLDLPFGMYIFKEDIGKKKRVPPPPPMTSSELSFTGGVEDVEKFLPPDIDLISLPHLTNLDLT